MAPAIAAEWESRLIAAMDKGLIAAAVTGAAAVAAMDAIGVPPLLGVVATAFAGGASALVHARMLRSSTARPTPVDSVRTNASPVGAGVSVELMNALPLGLLLVDARGLVLFVNAAAQDIIERRVTGLPAASALRTPALSEAIAAALSDGRAAELEATLLRGKERVIHAVVVPFAAAGQDDDAPRVAIMLEDRTRAAKAEALRRDFVANASHELRTPLASIAGFIETLQGHARNDPEAADRFLKIMAAQADRMRRLIDDLLSLNRIEINEHVLPRDRVDLIGVVRETVSALDPVATASGTAVEVDLPERPLLLRGSHDELSQVFANLIDNAIKYGGEGGPVRVALEAGDPSRPGMVGISVIDCGPGIAREHLPRLTERFYRVSNERSRERGGTGLGLAIAKHILNRHRGDLAVASTVGSGSRFTAWLPAAGDAEAPGRAA
jgi:two-component system phosphate regulon sensor histidine kinase PhoR